MMKLWRSVPLKMHLVNLRGGVPVNPRKLDEHLEKRLEKLGANITPEQRAIAEKQAGMETFMRMKAGGPRALADAANASEPGGLATIAQEGDAAVRDETFAAMADGVAPYLPTPTAEEEAEKTETHFLYEPTSKRLMLRAGSVRAHHKESAENLAKLLDGKENAFGKQIKALAANWKKRVRVRGQFNMMANQNGAQVWMDDGIFVNRPDGTPIMEADLMHEHPKHVPTKWGGTMGVLGRTAHINDAMIECKVLILNDGLIDLDLFQLILAEGCVRGFGQDRNQGYGVYTPTIVWDGKTYRFSQQELDWAEISAQG